MKNLIWLMGKPGSGKGALGKILESSLVSGKHYSFGELLKQIQATPALEGYTLDDRQRVYDFLKKEGVLYETLIIDGNPYPPTNFDRRKQIDFLADRIVNINLLCSDEIALLRLQQRAREILFHEGKDEKDRIAAFNTTVLPEIEKAREVYTIVDIDTANKNPEEILKEVLTLV